jgi:hypothetical protein
MQAEIDELRDALLFEYETNRMLRAQRNKANKSLAAWENQEPGAYLVTTKNGAIEFAKRAADELERLTAGDVEPPRCVETVDISGSNGIKCAKPGLQYVRLGEAQDYGDRRAAAAVLAERERCASMIGETARKWWSIRCASNKHMESTRKAHDDLCSLQVAILKGIP